MTKRAREFQSELDLDQGIFKRISISKEQAQVNLGVSEAKVAAGFCSESLGGKIAEYDFLGLNILISKDGDLNIHGDLRNSFVFKENKVSGVFAFTYEKEAVATDIKIEGASVVRN